MATGGGGESNCKQNTSGSDYVHTCPCQPCSQDGLNNEAHGYCVDCAEYLCRKCFDYHTKLSATKKHVLLDKNQMLSQNGQTKSKDKCTMTCPNHDDKRVKYHCTGHAFFGCSACIVLHHRHCKDVQCIKDVASTVLGLPEYKQLNSKLHDMTTKSKTVQKRFAEIKSTLTDSYTETVTAIENFTEKSIAELRKREKELLTQALELKTKRGKQLDSAEDNLGTLCEDIDTISKKINDLQNGRKHCDLYVEIMNVKPILDTLDLRLDDTSVKCPGSTFCFKNNTNLNSMISNADGLGKISISMTAEFLKDVNVKMSSDSSTCRITGSLVIHNKVLLADFPNKCIKAMDTRTCEFIEQLHLPGKPWSLTKINNSRFAVTLTHQQKICFVTIEPTMSVNSEIKVSGTCYGIACHGDNLAVSFPEDSDVRIEVLDMKGSVLNKISKHKDSSKMFIAPYYLAVNPVNQLIYVSCFSDNHVVCVKLDGSFVADYKDKEIVGPHQILFDSFGTGYVCGRDTSNIYQISADLKHGQLLISNNFDCPESMSYDETTGQIFIGIQNSNIIKVYKAK